MGDLEKFCHILDVEVSAPSPQGSLESLCWSGRKEGPCHPHREEHTGRGCSNTSPSPMTDLNSVPGKYLP